MRYTLKLMVMAPTLRVQLSYARDHLRSLKARQMSAPVDRLRLERMMDEAKVRVVKLERAVAEHQAALGGKERTDP